MPQFHALRNAAGGKAPSALAVPEVGTPEFGGAAIVAQAVTPAADGVGSKVIRQGDRFDIHGGQRSGDGANLFHSLSRFGLSREQIANFLATPDIRNILTRIVGGEASLINGKIQVTGGNANLFLVNPAGIVFGRNASLNVPAAFTATTATAIGFGNQQFNVSGGNDYARLSGTPTHLSFAVPQPGAIVNAGNLAVGLGQTLNLIGGTVINTGQLVAPDGQVTIAAVPGTSRVRLSPTGGLLSLELEPASRGTPFPITPLSLPELLTGGDQRHATGLATTATGELVLTGGRPIAAIPGTTIASGQLSTTGTGTGNVQILGDRIGVMQAIVDASGTAGGGTILIGGDYQGRGRLPTAQQTFVSADSRLQADARQQGNGGRIIVWSDNATEFYGSLSARGAAAAPTTSGFAGGFAEVSGKQTLVYQGTADLSAVNGRLGTLLLDPTNITIVSGSGGAQDGTLPTVPFAAPPTNSTISQTALQSQTAAVTLEASNNITIAPGVSLSFVPGGAITFRADADNSGSGSFTMDTSQTIQARGRSLSISGAAITVGNLDTGNIGSEDTSGGNIQLAARNQVTAGALFTGASSSSGAATSGNVTIQAGGNVSLSQIDATAIASTAELAASGGTVTITSGGLLTSGQIITSAISAPTTGPATATAGNVTLSATGINLTGASPIVANASTSSTGDSTAIGGSVSLSATTGNLNFFSISATGLTALSPTPNGTGGAVTLQAPQGVIQARATGNTILTAGSTTGGAITIDQGGGATNAPFVVGDATTNGTAGALVAGSASIAPPQTFPILPTGGVAPGTGGNNPITIVSRNTPPTLTATANLSGAQVNQPFAFTYSDLNPRVSDVDADNTSLVVGQITSGTLTVNGTAAIAGVTLLTPGDRLVYTPPANASGTIAAFALQAIDANGIARSALAPVQINITTTPSPLPPQPLPPPPIIDLPEIPLPIVESAPPLALTPLACSSTDAGVYSLEDKFTREFEEYFEKRAGTDKTRLIEACDALSRVETQTGIKPAVIYVSFAPGAIASTNSGNPSSAARSSDQLELIAVLPDRPPIYKRVSGATRALVMQVMRQFAIDLIDPTSRDTDSFLPGAQQLYQWLVQPLAADLKAQNVKNLVFILDAGLRSLPIAALHDGQQFLVEQYSLGVMPSLSITDTRPRDLTGAEVLAFGADRFSEQKPLPAVPIEINTILKAGWSGESFLNQNFTLNNLITQRQRQPYGIVHLATHAEFNPGAPQNSYIQLWDTKLRLDQVRQLGWNEPPVQLLTLSACRTALGDEQAELGFAGLAYQTGVRSVLASLWAVDDTGTLSLMTEFYRQLKTAPIRAEALRQAQLAMIRGQVRIVAGKLITPTATIALPPELADLEGTAFSSPFYWSAFTLIGNPW